MMAKVRYIGGMKYFREEAPIRRCYWRTITVLGRRYKYGKLMYETVHPDTGITVTYEDWNT